MTIISLLRAGIPQKKWSSHHGQQKSPKCSTWIQSQKWHNDLYSFPRQTIKYHSNPSLYPTSNAEEAEVEWFYEDLQHLLELTLKKMSLHHRGLECKSRKSRNTWSNRQIWPWNMEWSRAKTNRVLPRNALIITNTLFQQHKRRLYTWTSPEGQPKSDWLYSLQPKMEKLYTVSKNKTRSWLWLRPWIPYCQIQTEIEESRENH